MPSLANLMNVLLGYGTSAEKRSGARYRQPSETLSYGAHPLQALDLHIAPGVSEPRPLIAFLHGGAWQFGDKTRRLKDAKVPFAHGEGCHFAALNFRQVPEVSVAEMARDASAGVAKLFAHPAIDANKIILMGHSSGAHLAALVASDPALLAAHSLRPDMLAGLILIDGAAYNPSQPSTKSRFLRKRLIDPAFAGTDLDALSPALHARGANRLLPALILHTSPPYIVAQAAALESAWQAGGGESERHAFPGRGIINHMQLSRKFGIAGFGPTEIARRWLRALLAD